MLEGHVALEIECVDRLMLNANVPNLQVGGQVIRFPRSHLGHEIPSPALLGPIGNRFRRDVKQFATAHQVPILALKKPDRSRWDDRKLDHFRPYLEAAARDRRFGVVAIVTCQEFQWVISGRDRSEFPEMAATSTVTMANRFVGLLVCISFCGCVLGASEPVYRDSSTLHRRIFESRQPPASTDLTKKCATSITHRKCDPFAIAD